MKINWKKVEELVSQKYIKKTSHPTLPLWIFNYTEKCQFEKVWTEETLNCRGIITDHNYNIIARPFSKFFNVAEMKTIPDGVPELIEKLDGSLGILYFYADKPYIATRGSFTSEQALWATNKFKSHIAPLNDNHTHLFEIVYPQNRIVVNYGSREELVYLGSVHKETGKVEMFDLPSFNSAKRLGKLELDKIVQNDSEEGYVCHFDNGVMAKIKFDEYVRLHRLVTQVNARSIWDLLRNESPLDEILERVPDEFYQWVKDTKEKLEKNYSDVEEQCKELLKLTEEVETRKDKAMIIGNFKYASIVWLMVDGKEYKGKIWGYLRPQHELPFKKDE